MVSATIKDIKYSIGRYGIIVPMIELDTQVTTSMDQSTGKVLTSSNILVVPELGLYDEMDIGVGSIIDIEGYFINDIVTTLNHKLSLSKTSPVLPKEAKRLIPTHCPVCNTVIREYVGQYVCNNVSCPAQVYQTCIRFIRSVGIYLHGPYLAIFSTLVARKLIKSPLDIFITTDHEVLETLDNIAEKHLNLYKALINEAVGKISLNQLLVGLDIIPCDNTDMVREFVVNLSSKYANTEYSPFDIKALIALVYECIDKYHLCVDEEVGVRDISTQINKLSDKEYEEFNDAFNNIDSYRLGFLISYITNKNNRDMLLAMHNLGILAQ